MTFTEIINSLKQRKFSPIYLLHGEEAYYIDAISDYIEKNALSDDEKEFNQTIVYGRDAQVSQIIDIAKRYPMMSEYQVVIVKEAQLLSGFDQLASYFSKPIASTILVLDFKYKKVDKRTSAYKEANKHGVVFESEKLKDYKVPEWIAAYIQEKGFKANQKTIALLNEYLGNDLSKITNEIDKLALNIPEKAEITPELIERYIGISKDYNVFELTKALAEKNVLRANQIIQYFAENPGENPIQKVLPMMYSYFLKLLIFQTERQRSTPQDLMKKMGVRFMSDDYKNGAANYPMPKLIRIMGYFREYDARSKGIDNASSITGGELMKELVFKILH